MTDVEGNTRQSAAAPENPYAANSTLPRYDPVNILKRLSYMGVSAYGLYRFNFYRAVLQSPHINHEWFKIGLAATVALLGIKAYVEIFEGYMKKQKVEYQNFRQSTHAAIALILVSSLAFHIALWPHYGLNSIIVLSLAFFGVILQFLLLVPAWIQNIAGFVLLTFFLQEYK